MAPRLSATLSRLLVILLVVAVVGALVRAQSKEFYARRQALVSQAKSEQQTAGLSGSANAKALYGKFPTPEISLTTLPTAALQEGQPAPLSFTGKFSDQTTFMSGTEELTLSNVAVAANKFSATAQVAPGFGPGWARVYAFAPVSAAETWVPIFVGVPRAYTLTAKNGWTVKLTPAAQQFALDRRAAKVGYKAEYFKPGETKPFETTTGKLELDANNSSSSGSLSFNLEAGNQGAAMAEMEQVSNRMGELMKAGKFQGKEMADLQKRLEVLQAQMTKEVESQIADPAAQQKKQDDFGCRSIFLARNATGEMTGNINCGKNVGTPQVVVK